MSVVSSRGFALPTVIITSVIMLSVLLVGLTSVVSTNTSLEDQYISKLNKEASAAGLVMAKACLSTGGSTPDWTSAKPLKPNTNCAGQEEVSCDNTSTNPRCFVLSDDNYRTSFKVTSTAASDGSNLQLESKGYTDILRKTSRETLQRSTQTTKAAITIEGGQANGTTTRQENISLFAGSSTGSGGYSEGNGTSAKFSYPSGAAADSAGNVYISDTFNNRVRKITPAGAVTTFAGSGASGYADGTGTNAKFSSIRGVAVDSSDNVYVADSGNYRVRKITLSGVVTTLAGSGGSGYTNGTGTNAQFGYIYGITVDGAGNVYVSDNGNQRIRKITPAGAVSTLAGSGVAGTSNGTGASAQFNYPQGLCADSSGNIYVSDTNSHRIRKITPAGEVTTFAGSSLGNVDGTGTGAKFNYPYGVDIDADNNIYVSDAGNNLLRKITPSKVVTTVSITAGKLTEPGGAAIVDDSGTIYIVNNGKNNVYRLELTKTIPVISNPDVTYIGF